MLLAQSHQGELGDQLKSVQVFEDVLQAETGSRAQLPARWRHDTGTQWWARDVSGAMVLTLMDAT